MIYNTHRRRFTQVRHPSASEDESKYQEYQTHSAREESSIDYAVKTHRCRDRREGDCRGRGARHQETSRAVGGPRDHLACRLLAGRDSESDCAHGRSGRRTSSDTIDITGGYVRVLEAFCMGFNEGRRDNLQVSDSHGVVVLLTTNPVVDAVDALLVTSEKLDPERLADVRVKGLGVGWIEMYIVFEVVRVVRVVL